MPQLLAPAGQPESFWAAVESGADAVYLGLKQLNARASAKNFSLDELALLVPYAHRRRVAVHVTLNSSVSVGEISLTLDLLQSLSDLGVDAVIVQDPGIFYLARRHFPDLTLHASTLMAVHNHAGADQLQRMGACRVVLARELSLEEIGEIASRTRVELEVFVHGALCYSYSGWCLASSFRGGRSGLRGECVQPCRLRFRQGRKEGYFFSCNDLCALPLLPRLKRMRLSAFKIEGRMKPAEYIAQVVKAYRRVLDASPQSEQDAVLDALDWLAEAPSRRLTKGLMDWECRSEVLSPHRSGASGLWVGTVKKMVGKQILVELRKELREGDRLRPESLAGREESAFVVNRMSTPEGAELTGGNAGSRVLLHFSGRLDPGVRLFRVGRKLPGGPSRWQEIRKEVPAPCEYSRRFRGPREMEMEGTEGRLSPEGEVLLLRIADPDQLPEAWSSPARWVLLAATQRNLERIAKRRLHPAQKTRFAWSLPPLILEKDLGYYRAAVEWLQARGFTNWEVNNWGHFDLFRGVGGNTLIAGYRFNLRNHAAMDELVRAGCRWTVLSLEMTREELETLSRKTLPAIPVVTVYAWPPLFTSRLIPKLDEGRPLTTQRGDTYLWSKKRECAQVYAEHPVNWFEYLPVLRRLGFKAFLIDLNDWPSGQRISLQHLLTDFTEARAHGPRSLFNFNRSLNR